MDLLVAALLALAAGGPPAAADSIARRIVRELPPTVVEASRVPDLRSSEMTHVVTPQSLRDLPLSRLADAVALQPGVVAYGEDLHVRGGRAGELQVAIEDLPLGDPLEDRAPEIPLFAVERADLLAGGLEARHAGALAGVLDVRTWNPTGRLLGVMRWSTTGRRGTAYDWAGGRLTGPLHVGGLGFALAGDATLDDQDLPGRLSRGRVSFLGRRFGWRNDNRVLGWAKLAPLSAPRAFSLQAIASRSVREPWDPMFTINDSVKTYTLTPAGGDLGLPVLDSVETFYRGSDHLLMTDERRLSLIAWAERSTAGGSLGASLGWIGTRSLTSVGLRPSPDYVGIAPAMRFGTHSLPPEDPFLAYEGDTPYFRRTRSERWLGQVSWTRAFAHSQQLRAGVGALRDLVDFFEMDAGAPRYALLDTVRAFRTVAPGGWAYVQHRWESGGLVWSGGLRLQAFTAGPDATDATALAEARAAGAPAPRAHAVWTLAPRFGIAYPISTRDAFSVSYVRIHQPPPREYLAENRLIVPNRSPLGNPGLQPAELISWQAAVKHHFDSRWSLQGSLYERDVYGQIGIRNDPLFDGTFRPRFESVEDGHAVGFEIALLAGGNERTAARGVRGALARGELSLRYTFLNAWGSASNPDGWTYGPAVGFRPVPIGEHALAWDCRHLLTFDATLRAPGDWTVAWTTRLASGLPWTPATLDSSGAPQFDADESALDSRRLSWSEQSSLSVRLQPDVLRGARLLLDVRNVFDSRGDWRTSVSGYPNPSINTLEDDYAGYRAATGQGGGGYWADLDHDGTYAWVPVHDPRLALPPRSVRVGIEVGL